MCLRPEQESSRLLAARRDSIPGFWEGRKTFPQKQDLSEKTEAGVTQHLRSIL